MTKITIERSKNNGYIVTTQEEAIDLEGWDKFDKYVIAPAEEEAVSFAELCYLIEDLFGICPSRYEKKRPYIYVANGDKYTGRDADTKCPHCDREYNKDIDFSNQPE